jgi:hypothetical protein
MSTKLKGEIKGHDGIWGGGGRLFELSVEIKEWGKKYR